MTDRNTDIIDNYLSLNVTKKLHDRYFGVFTIQSSRFGTRISDSESPKPRNETTWARYNLDGSSQTAWRPSLGCITLGYIDVGDGCW